MSFSVDRYLGRRFDEVSYNCWDLLREAWLDLTGDDIGHRTPTPATPLAMRRRFDAEEAEFERLPEARSPCIVLMRRPRAVPHVGLFWKGRVLHIQPSGVRYDRLADATLGFTEIRFYATRHVHRQSDGAEKLGSP